MSRLQANKAQPNYMLEGNVFDAALNRIRWIFDEFDGKVTVATSGGKDSTVTMELSRMVAEERGELPLKVFFLDQEAEYQGTVDYMDQLMKRGDVQLDWYQIPFRLFNASSHTTQWTHCWDPELNDDVWIHPKHPDSIHVNDFYSKSGKMVDRFKKTLEAINHRTGGAILTGMRMEESPARRAGITNNPSYKWATWSAGKNENFKMFYPIYDWTYKDVWKSIDEHDWTYNTMYDRMFQYGIWTQDMRVSSFHHETGQAMMGMLQEIEPETWERATKRVPGLSTYSHVATDIMKQYRYKTPYMFDSRFEYLEYLIENLVEGEKNQEMFRSQRKKTIKMIPYVPESEVDKYMLMSVMFNDVYGTNITQWANAQTHPNNRQKWLDRK